MTRKLAMRKLALIILTTITLAGCSALGTPTALPTVVLGKDQAQPQSTPQSGSTAQPQTSNNSSSNGIAGGVKASGNVVPAQEVRLAFSVQERVLTVSVSAGDAVKTGQPLAQLDDTQLRAQIQQAQAALTAAQANHDLLAAGPTAEQLRQAEAAVVAATASYSRTLEGARPASIAAAQAALAAAIDAYNKVKAGPQPEDIAASEAALRNAQAALQQAQWAYDAAYKQNPAAIGASPAALALQQATNNFNAAKAAYDKVSQPADAAQVSAAYQQVQSARAALDTASAPARDFDIAQARSQVDAAQAALDALKAGARTQQLDAAKAQVDQAQAALNILLTQQQKYTLAAPLDGVVLSRAVEPGEIAAPGSPVLVLADLSHLRVETTDLSERDVPLVTKGQAVTVLVKALEQDVPGHVRDIAPDAGTLGGDVVYKTTIDLDTLPPGLRAGMSVEVQFGAGK